MEPRDQILDVWGDLACFTRPEFKVERFSYPIITPSAARGIYDAIYCKPNKNRNKAEFSWRITKIEILSVPEYISLRRNEVKEKVPSEFTISKWMDGTRAPEPIWADGMSNETGTDQKGRTQRQTMALKNVHYRLHAFINPWGNFNNHLSAMEAQFRRRASQGKCFYQPFFGCREFPAYFELVEQETPVTNPIHFNMDIGWMVYDVFDLSKPGNNESHPSISLFHATVIDGILVIPDYRNKNEVKYGINGVQC
jgi:CRISPR-associated protein Cas5d